MQLLTKWDAHIEIGMAFGNCFQGYLGQVGDCKTFWTFRKESLSRYWANVIVFLANFFFFLKLTFP